MQRTDSVEKDDSTAVEIVVTGQAAATDDALGSHSERHPDAVTPSNDNKLESRVSVAKSVRWDLIFTLYLLGIIVTIISFGCSHDGQFDNFMFSAAFLHFAFETQLSCYLLCSEPWARRLSILAIVVLGTLSVLTWFLSGDLFLALFFYNFTASDSLSIMSSVMAVLSADMPQCWKMLPIAVSMHFIGAFIQFAIIPREMFQNGLVPQHGAGWFWIGFLVIPQIYIGRDVIRGRFNEIGTVRYDDTSPYVAAFRKFGVPVIAYVVAPVTMLACAVLRTTEDETAGYFATGIWKDLILNIGLPVAFLAIVAILYAFATKDLKDKQR